MLVQPRLLFIRHLLAIGSSRKWFPVVSGLSFKARLIDMSFDLRHRRSTLAEPSLSGCERE
jgi:hypothetical protein